MISNMTIYEGAFRNKETNIDNENIQQIFSLRIFDTETPVTDTPYNVRYRITVNGDGTQTVTVTLDELPDFIDSAEFGYNDGAVWYDTEVHGTHATILIPEGDWIYSFVVNSELGETRRLLSTGTTIDLEMGETPLRFSVVDNDEDKFSPVRSKQVEIEIHSSDQVDISRFAEGGDNRYYVEIESQVEGIIFVGWLSIADLQQEFLPDPNIITLIATDGLGFLQDEPLVNFDGETPIGVHRIIDFIAWSLARTGHKLDIKASMNIREETAVPLVSDDSGAGHMYTHIYLDARTFEAEIGVGEDSLTVLEKILGENSFITQYKGKWVIVRIDELETGHDYYFTRFNHLGAWIENTIESFQKDIGVDYLMAFMNDDAVVSLERPYKSIIEKFNYDYPQEAVCNIDFARGDVRVAPDLSAANSEGTYELDCWVKQMFPTSGTAIVPSTNDAYVKRLFEYGYEKDRYLVLVSGSAANNEGVMSQPVDISVGDKIEVSVDWRLASNVGSGDGRLQVKVFNVLIITDSGDYWYLAYVQSDLGGTDLPTWIGPFDGQRNQAVDFSWIPDTTDETQWVNISANAPPAPASGKLYIGLFKEWQGSSVYEVDTYFADVQLTLIPQVNGSYQRYTGQQHSVTQDNDKIKAVREHEVYISDAPRIAMKGALLKQGAGLTIYTGSAIFGDYIAIAGDVEGSFPIGAIISITGSAGNDITTTVLSSNFLIIGDVTQIYVSDILTSETADVTITMATYVLAGLFYNAAKLISGPTTQAEVMPYGQIQAFDVWNQFNRVFRKFEGTVDRTESDTELPDIIHRYIIRDINNNTTDGTQYRIFQLLHYEMDVHLCEWDGFLVEVFNTDVAKNYEGHDFKYITQ